MKSDMLENYVKLIDALELAEREHLLLQDRLIDVDLHMKQTRGYMNKARKTRRHCADCYWCRWKRFLFWEWFSCRKKTLFKKVDLFDKACDKFVAWQKIVNNSRAGLKKRLHCLGKSW